MNVLKSFKEISTFVFDVDGVLTDGMLAILPGGVMARSMNVKDGYALQLAVKRGYKVVIISGGNSEDVAERLQKLGVTSVYMKVTDKVHVLSSFLNENKIAWQEVLYMGDDIPDLDVMQKCGVACCPKDAVQEIKAISSYISHIDGGKGCGRDVIEKVLKLRGNWSENTHIPSI